VPSMERDGAVFVLSLGDGENRFNAVFLDGLEACLTEVEAAAPCALVTTAVGKIWSNGLDLEWLGGEGEAAMEFVGRVHRMFARVLEIGVPTVAAIQGHAFAAGAMLALAHDERLMRSDRGFFCLPEVDIGIPFTPGMNSLITARLSARTAHEAMTTGRRYGGEDAAEAGIVDAALAEQELLTRAVERAGALAGKNPDTLGTIKRRLYSGTLEALRDPSLG
jgi:enoyl-CoA hydratase/carnithine racemase